MRNLVMFLATLGGLVTLTGGASACSIRGQYCGYPSWAANSFEGRFGFNGNPAILTDQYKGKSPRKVVKKRK